MSRNVPVCPLEINLMDRFNPLSESTQGWGSGLTSASVKRKKTGIRGQVVEKTRLIDPRAVIRAAQDVHAITSELEEIP